MKLSGGSGISAVDLFKAGDPICLDRNLNFRNLTLACRRKQSNKT